MTKVAIVTGGSSGIGEAAVHELRRRGWSVAAMARTKVPEEFRGDVAQDADCRRVTKAVLDRWGRIDALVNCAGTTKFVAHTDLEGLSAEDILGIFRVNLVGPFQAIRACAPALKASRGCVVNISSVASILGTGSSIAYAASKAALDTMSFSLARALAPEIRVNIVAPGYVRGAAGTALRRARAAQGRGRAAGCRRGNRVARGGRAPRHRRDHLRRRRHAHRFPAVKHDYIIVGAGSAGCVLANRLSDSPSKSILLLEAGPRDTNIWIQVPLGYGKLFTRTDVNWAYESEPEPALNGRRIFSPRGKVLGGSSSINGLVYIRGQPEDFDGWGIRGWDFSSLAPYFARAESELNVSALERHELCDAFIASARALGIPANEDFNGACQEGTGYYRATTYRGRRQSTATAYLRPAEKRRNLRVEVNALATKILFEGKRAVGVAYRQRGQDKTAYANEILLCGGSFNSPQLLELSGVG